jgi:uncharacterized protein YegL
MKKDLTEIVLILDESGSMGSVKNDTIGGFNEFLSSQKKIKGDANVTFVKFSDYYKVVNDGTDIAHVAELNESNYTPSYSTALLDAVGKTINSVGQRLSDTPENKRPEKVIVAIITDGWENTSKEFSKKQINEMVAHQRDNYQWEFLFLGADIDAWGGEIGIRSNVTMNKADMIGNMSKLSYYTANYRMASADLSLDNFNLSNDEVTTKLADLYVDKDKK